MGVVTVVGAGVGVWLGICGVVVVEWAGIVRKSVVVVVVVVLVGVVVVVVVEVGEG